MTKIYCLKDQNGVVMYVGQTSHSLEYRLEGHLSSSYSIKYPMLPRHLWIISLRANGFKPSIELIEECEDKDADLREAIHITKAHMINPNLTNVAKVGKHKEVATIWRKNNQHIIKEVVSYATSLVSDLTT